MRGSRLNMAALLAMASIGGLAVNDPKPRRVREDIDRPRIRLAPSTKDEAARAEIMAHNAAVDERNAEKRQAKRLRKLAKKG